MANDDAAPFGYEDDGVTPKTPYGLKVDGTPRRSNRGARPGQRGNTKTARQAPRTNKTDSKRKEMLLSLADSFLVTPLAAVSSAPGIETRLGKKNADALAGDAIIISSYAPNVADGLILLSQTKPGVLSWLDRMEDKAPYLVLLQAGIQMGKALVANHLNPDARLAAAGKQLPALRAAQMAEAIESELREMRAMEAMAATEASQMMEGDDE